MKRIAAYVLVLAAVPAVADAAILPGFSGNTNMTFSNIGGATNDGTLNFAVYQADSGGGFAGLPTDWTNFAGSTSPVADSTYLYLYQAVNNGTGPAIIGRTTVEVGSTPITSFGYFPDSTFVDSSGDVSAGNDFGEDGMVFQTSPGAVPNGAAAGSSPPYPMLPLLDVASAGVSAPGSTDPLAVTAFGGSVGATYLPIPVIGEGFVVPGARGSIFGFTTDVAPKWSTGSIINGVTASGTVASPVPVPGVLVALLSLTPVGLGWYWRRKNRK